MEQTGRIVQDLLELKKRWDAIIENVNHLHHSAVRDKNFLACFVSTAKVSGFLKNFHCLLTCPLPQVSPVIRQKAAALIGILLVSQLQTNSCEQFMRKFLSILYNFRIGHKFKVFFIKAAAQARAKWQRELDFLYEKSLLALLALLQRLQANGQQGAYQQKVIKNGQEAPYLIDARWPQDRDQIYGTVWVMGKILTEKQQFQSQEYGIQLATIFCQYTTHVMKNGLIQSKPQIVQDLLSFWKDFLLVDFEMTNQQEVRAEQRCMRQQIALQISRWPCMYQQLIKIICFASPKAYQQQLGQQVYNLLCLQPPFEDQIYYLLKQKSAIVFSELIFADMSNFQQNTSIRFCREIRGSISYSLQWFLESVHSMSKEQELTCIDLLQLFYSVLSIEMFLDYGQQRHLIVKVLLPLIEFYLENALFQYTEDVETFINCLEDCTMAQQEDSMLSKLTKVLDILLQQNKESEQVLSNCLLQSLKAKKIQILHRQLPTQQNVAIIENTTSFFILSVFACKFNSKKEKLQILKEILVAQYISQLQEIEVAMIYELFCSLEPESFSSGPFVGQLIASALSQVMSSSLRAFAVKMLYNFPKKYFARAHLVQFIRIYNQMGSIKFKSQLLRKLISHRLDLFTSQDFILIIDNCKLLMDLELDLAAKAMQHDTKYSTNQIYDNLLVCQKIAAKSEIWLHDPQINQSLWNLSKMLEQFHKIGFDDAILKLINSLLQPLQTLPSTIAETIEQVKVAFEMNEFRGSFYFQFFQLVHKRCTQKDEGVLNQVLQTMVEAACIVIYFPEESQLDQEHFITLSNSLWVLQNLLIGNKLSSSDSFSKQVMELVRSFPLIRERLSLYSKVEVRYLNFILSASRSLQIIVDFELIKQVAREGKFKDFEAKMLVSELSRALPGISGSNQRTVWLIIMFVLRAGQDRPSKPSRDGRGQEREKLKSFLFFVEPPFPLERALDGLVRDFVEEFKKQDFKGYQTSLNDLLQSEYLQICRLLQMDLNLRKLVKLDRVRVNHTNANSMNQHNTNEGEQTNRQLTFDSQVRESIEAMQRLKLRSSPFQRMQAEDTFSDQQDRELLRRASKLQKYRIHNILTKRSRSPKTMVKTFQ